MEGYYFDEHNNFIIEDYQKAKTFSSFLPGIAGKLGIPIWSFYVNRGQGISSFGIQDKDNSIMEFFPANSAYQYVTTYGFRTFIKDLSNDNKVYEPFKDNFSAYNNDLDINDEPTTRMTIMKDSFIIEDFNRTNGVHIKVTYSTLSNVPFGGLIRSLEVTNTTDELKELNIIDGMPALLPYGIENLAYKRMSNLMRSWMEVSHIDKSVPFYKLRSSTKDEAVVSTSDGGYFYINESVNDEEAMTIYDPKLVFDYQTDLQVPIGFMTNSYSDIMEKEQVFANKVPSAFQMVKCSLKPGEHKTINSIIGYVADYKLIENFSATVDLSDFVQKQMKITKDEINALCNDIKTTTGVKAFDEYIKQTYLDNILRGGKPIFFEGQDKDHVYHIYSRKHGDPERDYNFFSLEASAYSQGNGNYRDVCQNRRNDVIMDPKVKNFNVWMFYNLIQADGYNPLSIKGTKFIVAENNSSLLDVCLKDIGLDNDKITKISNIVKSQYTPGGLLSAISKIEDSQSKSLENQEIIKCCLKFSQQEIDVDFAEGFWSDHFTYNQDLIDTYEYMYPDQIQDTLFEEFNYQFYNAPYYGVPRDDKYNLVEDGVVRQYDAIAKKKQYKSTWVTNEDDKVIKTNLFNKLLVLSLTKFMNLDPFAMGLEMEGDKPGWNDALNGLPGLIGSGMSETIELKRCVDYLVKTCEQFSDRISVDVLEDIFQLLHSIRFVMKDIDISRLHTNTDMSYELWDRLNLVKEDYRLKIKNNMLDCHQSIDLEELQKTLIMMSTILENGILKSLEVGNGIMPSYFVNEVIEYKLTGKTTTFGKASVKPLVFKQRALPFFLEAPTRYLKSQNPESGRGLYEKIKLSGIYDQGLKMYKTSESLETETLEIGRIRAFTPGWLERESVFLHMTYKYLLSMLDSGLYDEFYEEIKTNLIPMLSPDVYGRATTENSSFIASSVNPDKSVVGQGFVARLSGSTAEAVSMWVKMFIGKKGFTMKNNELNFTFEPNLTSEFFDDDGKVTFSLFGHTRVTYINVSRKDTFGENKGLIDNIVIDGVRIQEDYLNNDLADKLRNKEVNNIEVTFK